MTKLSMKWVSLFGALLLSSSVILVGCSSHPNAEEMKQLNNLKEEYAALQKDTATKEQQKAALDKEVAEKNAKLKKCNDDQQIVKQRLAK